MSRRVGPRRSRQLGEPWPMRHGRGGRTNVADSYLVSRRGRVVTGDGQAGRQLNGTYRERHMRIATWNMANRKGAWEYLFDVIKPDYALLQEAQIIQKCPG